VAQPDEGGGGSDRAVAVIVAHGMGQQIPFETLDSVGQGLLAAEQRRHGTAPGRPLTAHVSLGGQRLARVALTLRTRDGDRRTVHLYEAYWAPFTEGQIGLAGVTTFLWHVGLNGFWHGLQPLQRWMFGALRAFDPPVRTLVFIVTALAAVAALFVMNVVIVAVAARSSLFAEPAAWPSDAMRADLAAIFAAVLATMVVFGVALVLNKFGGALRRVGGALAVVTFVLAIATTIAAGIAIPAIVLLHRTREAAVFATGFTEWTARIGSAVIALAVGGVIALILARILPRAWREWRRSRQWFSLVVALLFGGLVALLGFEIACFVRIGASSPPPGRPGTGVGALLYGAGRPAVIWFLVVLASALVRSFLVQYVGDVAIYVESQRLDRYFQVRDRIKQSVRDTARAVYGAPGPGGRRFAYEAVFVVGHSLGSVIAYDTLNRLLWDDTTAATGQDLDVRGRTKLLLTFGSPLDKTAFFFATQRKRGSSDLREMLAATVQPLIEDVRYRTFRWINVYSPWDIISGRLDYYDLPDGSNPSPVQNQIDPCATTLLWAHVEYWKNPLVYDALHGEIAGWPLG
jgi:hypothetical protein